jgi:hypothetical protein
MPRPNLHLYWRILLIVVLVSLPACTQPFAPPTSQPLPEVPTEAIVLTEIVPQLTATHEGPEVSTISPVASSTVIIEPSTLPPSPQPTVEPPPSEVPSAGPTLAFLKAGDIWLLDEPGSQPYPLTVAGDILSFAWAPGGERLAAFNGKTLCFINRDGSVRTACLDLGLNESQSRIERRLLLSPDQRWVVLWNQINPQDAGAIGWMIVALDTSNSMYRIEDPVEWGAALDPNNEPGGFTGQPIFLANDQLVGTLTHRNLCGVDGCHYRLFQFDLFNKTFSPYPDQPKEGFSEGEQLFLSNDHRILANFGTFIKDCDNYFTDIDTFDLISQSRQTYKQDKEALIDLAFNSAVDQAILARRSGCSDPGQNSWASECGLVHGADLLPMQLWTVASNERKDLYPGSMPAWSPDNGWTAFQSCLAKSDAGAWEPSGKESVGIYLLDQATGNLSLVSDGASPQWRPEP